MYHFLPVIYGTLKIYNIIFSFSLLHLIGITPHLSSLKHVMTCIKFVLCCYFWSTIVIIIYFGYKSITCFSGTILDLGSTSYIPIAPTSDVGFSSQFEENKHRFFVFSLTLILGYSSKACSFFFSTSTYIWSLHHHLIQ